MGKQSTGLVILTALPSTVDKSYGKQKFSHLLSLSSVLVENDLSELLRKTHHIALLEPFLLTKIPILLTVKSYLFVAPLTGQCI